jgi:hypothetical protein
VPKIPGAEALGGAPSGRSGRAIATIDTSSVASAVEQFGHTAQAVVQDLSAQRQKTETYEAERRVSEFLFNEEKSFNDAAANVAPGAPNFAASYADGYRARAKEFATTNLGGLSKDSQREFDHRLFTAERRLFLDAATTERAERSRYGKASLAETIDNTVLPRAGGAKTPEDFESLVADANRTIDSNPTLTPIERDEEKLKTRQRLELALLDGKTNEERDAWLKGGSTVDKIIGAESRGDPNAKNPHSSATGLGQFIESTWLDVIGRYRPDLTKGKTRDEILELRSDPGVAREMTTQFAAENGRYLAAHGLPVNAGTTYLAHFAGPDGAVKLLTADPDATAASVLGQKAVDANEFLAGKSAADVVAWADGKMAGAKGESVIKALPFETRSKLLDEAEKGVRDDLVNGLMVNIRDGVAGEPEIEAARTAGWLVDAGQIKAAKDAAEETRLVVNTAERMADEGYVFNRFDNKEVSGVNKLYEKGPAQNGAGLLDEVTDPTGFEPQAYLRGIVARTGIVPTAAADVLKTGIWSNDHKRRNQAFMVMDGLSREDPEAAAVAFGTEAMKRLDIYQTLAPTVPPEELNKELDIRDPQTMKLHEDLRADGLKLAKDISIDTIMNEGFDPSRGLFDQANISDEAGLVRTLRSDFDNNFAAAYASVRNVEAAKALAFKWLGNKWGPSDSGSTENSLMEYPPEKRYPALNGSHSWIGEQVQEAVKADNPDASEYGVVPALQTASEYTAGREPGYHVWYLDENGGFNLKSDASGAPMVVRFNYEQARQDAYSKRAPEDAAATTASPGAKSGKSKERALDDLKTFVGPDNPVQKTVDGVMQKINPPIDPEDPMYRNFRGDPNNPMGRQQ